MSPSFLALAGTFLGVQVVFVLTTLALAAVRRVHVPLASIGLGPPLRSVTFGGLTLQLGLVPLGAFVQLLPPDGRAPTLPDGWRGFSAASPLDQALLHLAPWALLGGGLAVADPSSLGRIVAMWTTLVLGALQPLTTGASAWLAAWTTVQTAPPMALVPATTALLVATNTLPWPTMSVGQVLLMGVPERGRERVRLLLFVAQTVWMLGWLGALGAAVWAR